MRFIGNIKECSSDGKAKKTCSEMNGRMNSNKPLGNEDGLALVTALMLGLFGMLLVAALLFMVNAGTWISGSQQRHQKALAAAHGGNNLFVKDIIQRGIEGTNLSAMGSYDRLGFEAKAENEVFADKLMVTENYPVGPENEDVIITFPSPDAPIAVHVTLASTNRGNSGAGTNLGFLETGGVEGSTSSSGRRQHIPFLYQIRAEGQNAASTTERAVLNSLYMY